MLQCNIVALHFWLPTAKSGMYCLITPFQHNPLTRSHIAYSLLTNELAASHVVDWSTHRLVNLLTANFSTSREDYVTLCFSVTYFTITCQHINSSGKQPEVLRSPKVSVSKLNTIMQSTTVYIMLQYT